MVPDPARPHDERPDLEGADREGADREGPDLEGRDLEGRDLEGRDLEGPDLEGPDLEELYDAQVLSLIDAQTLGRGRPTPTAEPAPPEPSAPEPAAPGAASPVRFRRARSGVLAAAMLGVGEVFEPEPNKQSVIEFAPAPADHRDEPIEFVYVHGSPERSRIIFRPWL